MAYLKRKPRKLADGTVQVYWYRCEAYRDEKERSREKILEYLGVNPQRRTFTLDPALAARVALALLDGKPSPAVVWDRLKGLGLDLPGRPQQVSLTYNPPPAEVLSTLPMTPGRSVGSLTSTPARRTAAALFAS